VTRLAPQPNARLGPQTAAVQVRVGVPHRGGRLPIACWRRGYPVMVSAAAFWDRKKRRMLIPTVTPLWDCDVVLDSAGFTAMQGFARRETPTQGIAGIYPWTLEDYLVLASSLGGCLSWYAQPDFCCEPEIASDQETRTWRVRATATLLEANLRTVAEWQHAYYEGCRSDGRSIEAAERVARDLLSPPVPVLQGWTADDYRESCDLLAEVWERWEGLYGLALVGVGSVCRRGLTDPIHGIEAILRAIEDRLPSGARLHLFGVKGAALRALTGHPRVASVDSMAYDFAARREALVNQHSNSMSHRIDALDRWMSKNGCAGYDTEARG